jgi:hypothetical protein
VFAPFVWFYFSSGLMRLITDLYTAILKLNKEIIRHVTCFVAVVYALSGGSQLKKQLIQKDNVVSCNSPMS